MPPYSVAEPLAFKDVVFRVENFNNPATGQRRIGERCGADDSFLDEFIDAKSGEKVYQCSDSDYCDSRMSHAEGKPC